MDQNGDDQMDTSSTFQDPPGQLLEETTKSASSLPQAPLRKPRNIKGTTILIAACAVILFTLIGGLVYIATKKYPMGENPSSSIAASPEEIPNEDTSSNSTETIPPAKQIVSELKTIAVGEQQRVDATTEHGGIGPTDGAVYTTAAYRSGGQKFAVYPANSYGFGTTSTAKVAADDEAAVRSYLFADDFTETPEGSGIFVSEDAVCAVRLVGDTTEKTLNGVSVGCGNLDDYDENYQEALPFFTAFIASKPESAQNLLFSSPVIKNGADGYRNAYVSIGSAASGSTDGFTGLFYSAPVETEWTFFIGTQNDLDCAVFNTATLKKAFHGQRCIDMATGKESTVTG